MCAAAPETLFCNPFARSPCSRESSTPQSAATSTVGMLSWSVILCTIFPHSREGLVEVGDPNLAKPLLSNGQVLSSVWMRMYRNKRERLVHPNVAVITVTLLSFLPFPAPFQTTPHPSNLSSHLGAYSITSLTDQLPKP